MKELTMRKIVPLVVSFIFLLMPVLAFAQSENTSAGPPPIAAPLVREGSLAVKLVFAFGLGTTDDEVEAENQLAEAGVIPKNGWIADYPVTPDIIEELQISLNDATSSGKLSLSAEEALQRFNNTLSVFGLLTSPDERAGEDQEPQEVDNYPNPAVVNNYYYNQGPPVVTYYAPPPNFFYLYAWVPFPFWWSGFWFPGFYVLHDFHKPVIINRRVHYISNHFRDVRASRVFRIDPEARFRGKTFGGIGSAYRKGLLSTGVTGGERRIFNRPLPRQIPHRSRVAPPGLRNGAGVPSPRGGRIVTPPARETKPGRTPEHRGGMVAPPLPREGIERSVTPREGDERGGPSRGGRVERPGSREIPESRAPVRSGGTSSERGRRQER